jgi:hypothetical protein
MLRKAQEGHLEEGKTTKPTKSTKSDKTSKKPRKAQNSCSNSKLALTLSMQALTLR